MRGSKGRRKGENAARIVAILKDGPALVPLLAQKLDRSDKTVCAVLRRMEAEQIAQRDKRHKAAHVWYLTRRARAAISMGIAL